MTNTIEQITNSLLIKNKINGFDKKDLELQLQIHPNYPSFQSITDTLDYFTIENIAVEVPPNALDQLPKTFVTILEHDDKTEIALIVKTDKKITIKHTSVSQSSMSYEEFKEIWIPKIIAVEEGEPEQKTKKHSNFLKQAILAVAGIAIAVQLYVLQLTLLDALIIGLSVAGGILSFFAVRESLGYKSQVLQSFCTTIKQSNCNQVITSKKGELLPGISFADTGIIFFTILSTYILLFGVDSILIIPSLLGFPFILYSLYSQQFIIKQWCMLCLGISAITVLLSGILFLNYAFHFNLDDLLALTLISSVISLIYLNLKNYIKENRTLKTNNLKLHKFKRNPELFEQLLFKSSPVQQQTFNHEIILGNPKAPFAITSLTNPLCGFCKAAFESYIKVLKASGENLKIIVRMPVNTEKIEAPASRIAYRLLEIYEKEGQKGFIEAYANWFENRTIETWSKKYGLPEFTAQHTELLNKQKEWATKNNLNYTPATIINNRLYPKTYDYEEFFYFTQHLLENYESEPIETREVVSAT
ncbi:vitamin K epoxide reductase family protein [Aquimarina intermedia]|uniref:Thioredoxin-like protein n=1 Tax=Aquimarina intermedia TaxID=350814 RepID=A0A5S5C9V6_9FLAO|nr:vitamin K epoxide reductase family protein [Aquimarina intermedia]TYP76087.1 thioredoxin-like protein [Aquimarina intermedia]